MRGKIRNILVLLLTVIMLGCASVFAACSQKPEEPDDDKEQQQPVDTVSPVITISGEKTYNIAVGEELTLPSATVTDDTDGDISADLYRVLSSGSKFASITNGVFKSDVGGVYEVIYYAEDKAGNEAYETVTVMVTAATSEAQKEGTSNDLSALNTSGNVFYENFENGPENVLFKNSYKSYFTLTGTTDAINGNSLIIDYSKLSNQTNKISLTNLMPYVKTGRWTVEFDVKLVSGVGFSDFMFSYSLNGETDVQSYDKRYDISDMTVGEVRHISYTKTFEVIDAEAGEYYFYIYKVGTEYIESVLAFDNFTFKWEETPYVTYIPTLEELGTGFTYDWSDDKFAYFGEPVLVNDIENASVKNVLTASDNFGDRVMHLTGSSLLNGLLSANNSRFFEPNKVYNITINYYTVAKNTNSYLTVFNGSANNRTLRGDLFNKVGQVASVSVRYITGSGENGFYFYTSDEGWDIYVGNITVSLTERKDIDMDGKRYEPTEQDIIDGYTFDMSDGNLPYLESDFTDFEYYSLDKTPVTIPQNIQTQYFKSGYALKMSGYAATVLDAFTGNIATGNVYGLKMTVYAEGNIDGNIHLLLLDALKNQTDETTGAYRLGIVKLDEGVYEISGYITCDNATKYIAFFSKENFDFYVADMTVYALNGVNYETLTKEAIVSGYSSNFNDKLLKVSSSDCVNEWTVGINGTGTDRYLHVTSNPAGNFNLDFTKGLIEAGKSYTLTITAKRISKSNILALFMGENGEQVLNASADFIEEDAGDGFVKLTLTFDGKAEYSYINVFNHHESQTTDEMFIKQITFSSTEDTRKAANVTSATVDGDGYVSDFEKEKFTFTGGATIYGTVYEGANTYYVKQVGGATPSFDFASLNGSYSAGGVYMLNFKAKVVTGGTLVVLYMNEGGTQIGNDYARTAQYTKEEGISSYTYYLRIPSGCVNLRVFLLEGSLNEMYITEISFKKVGTTNNFTLTTDYLYCNTDGDVTKSIETGITGVDATAQKYIHLTVPKYMGFVFSNFDGLMNKNETYEFSFTAYEKVGASLVLLQLGADGNQIAGSPYTTFSKEDKGNGYYEFKTTFTALNGVKNLKIFVLDGDTQEFYISSVTLSLTA